MRTTLNALFSSVVLQLLISGGATGQGIDRYIEWTDRIALEETEGVFTVAPYTSIDPHGGFIVVDMDEAQVRLYSRDGSLRQHFGRRGQGPGEFNFPMSGTRLNSGEILIPNHGAGRLVRYSDQGEFLSQSPRLFPVFSHVRNLHGHAKQVLVVGSTEPRRPGAFPLLHVYDVESETIVRSFFPHPIPLGSYGNVLFGLGRPAVADIRGDRIVAAFGPLERLFFFDLEGRSTGTIDIPFKHFRTIRKPSMNGELSSQEIWDYMLTFSKIGEVLWMSDDIILIQYYDHEDSETWTPTFSVAAIRTNGTILFEVYDAPRLVSVDGATGEIFFEDPDHPYRNVWRVGRIKPHILERATYDRSAN